MKKKLSIAEIASQRNNAATLQRAPSQEAQDDLSRFLDTPQPSPAATPPAIEPATPSLDVTAPKRRNVAASKRGNAVERRGTVLPHDSIYLHPDVRKAIKIHAVENDMKLQEVLRLAIKQYLDRKGIKFRNLETGERESATAS